MPRSSVTLTLEPVTGDVVVAAAQAVITQTTGAPTAELEARVVDDGAVLQIAVGGETVLSVLRPRLLPTLDEVDRLLPGPVPPRGTQWWTDAYTPWQPEGAVGMAILEAAAEASVGIVVHQGIASRSPRH